MKITKVEISKDEVLKPGDRVEIHFDAPGPSWLKATTAALIENRLENREGFRIRSINYQEPGKLIFTAEVLKTNPVVVTAGLIIMSILTVAGILGLALVLDKIYKIIQTIPGSVGTVSLAVIGIIVALIFYKRQGGRYY